MTGVQTCALPICFPVTIGQTISLSATAGATTYSWTGPNGFTSNLQNPTIPNATPLDSGTYTLNYTTPNCNGTASTLVVVNTPINPAFTQINPICHNGAVPALSGTSNNVPTAITGTWNPPTISSASPGTFTYTFTPAAQFCANPATMNITILPNETPTFTQINPMCINSAPPVLPNPSTNATPYTGTWTPPTITTASAGTYTYTFTPTAGQCAVATTMDINILNYTYPTFQQMREVLRVIADYCTKSFEGLGTGFNLNYAMHESFVVPYSYISKRLMNTKIFRKDSLGSTRALKRAIGNLVDNSDIARLPQQQTIQNWGFSGEAFIITNASLLDEGKRNRLNRDSL